MDNLHLDILQPDLTSSTPLPFAESGVQAGFPSPAADYISETYDLNMAVVRHPASTFFARVHGMSMCKEGICDGDIIVVDRSLEPNNDDLAVCCIDGEFTLKRIRIEQSGVWLIPSSDDFDPILVTPDNDFCVWGVVTHTIKQNRRPQR